VSSGAASHASQQRAGRIDAGHLCIDLAASSNSVTPEVATAAIVLVAAVKVRLVIWQFMGVRRASLALRLVCDGWLLAVTALIVTVYLV
jgi:hypothetical protein